MYRDFVLKVIGISRKINRKYICRTQLGSTIIPLLVFRLKVLKTVPLSMIFPLYYERFKMLFSYEQYLQESFKNMSITKALL